MEHTNVEIFVDLLSLGRIGMVRPRTIDVNSTLVPESAVEHIVTSS